MPVDPRLIARTKRTSDVVPQIAVGWSMGAGSAVCVQLPLRYRHIGFRLGSSIDEAATYASPPGLTHTPTRSPLVGAATWLHDTPLKRSTLPAAPTANRRSRLLPEMACRSMLG